MTNVTAPTEPPTTKWIFPDPMEADDDIVAVGADLEPATVLAPTAQGMFPMPLTRSRDGWWSPVRRGVLPLDGFRVTKSMRQSRTRFDVTVDKAYDDVVAGCADPDRPGAWIDDEVIAAYRRLYDLGWAHSVEVWRRGRAGRRSVRRGDRWAVRRGVDVPPRARRLEGRADGAGRAARRRTRRSAARRAVVDAAPHHARRDRGRPRRTTCDAAACAGRCRCRGVAWREPDPSGSASLADVSPAGSWRWPEPPKAQSVKDRRPRWLFVVAARRRRGSAGLAGHRRRCSLRGSAARSTAEHGARARDLDAGGVAQAVDQGVDELVDVVASTAGTCRRRCPRATGTGRPGRPRDARSAASRGRCRGRRGRPRPECRCLGRHAAMMPCARWPAGNADLE